MNADLRVVVGLVGRRSAEHGCTNIGGCNSDGDHQIRGKGDMDKLYNRKGRAIGRETVAPPKD